VTGGDVAAAVLQRNAMAAIVNASRVIASVHITLSLPCGAQKEQNPAHVKDGEVIADNLSKAGLGCVSAIDSNGEPIWIADAHHGDGKCFVARAYEFLTAFIGLEAAIRGCGFLA
jgi:hypothetical protein